MQQLPEVVEFVSEYPRNQAFALLWVDCDGNGCIPVRSRLHGPVCMFLGLLLLLCDQAPACLLSDEKHAASSHLHLNQVSVHCCLWEWDASTSQLSADLTLGWMCIYKGSWGLLTWPRQADKVKKSVLLIDMWPSVVVFYLNMQLLICYIAMANWHYLERISLLDSN